MLRVDIQMAPVEGIVLGVVAGEVELGAASELPAAGGLRRVELDAKYGILHRKRRLVAVARMLVRAHIVGVIVALRTVRVVDALEHEVAVRSDLQTRLAERLEDAGRGVSQVVLLAGLGGEDAASVVRLGRLVPLEGRSLGDIALVGLFGGGYVALLLFTRSRELTHVELLRSGEILLVGLLGGGHIALALFLHGGYVALALLLDRSKLLPADEVLHAGLVRGGKLAVLVLELGNTLGLSLVGGLERR